MNIDNSITCPKCNGNYFELKREATYVYTYKINSPDTKTWSEEKEALPFLFDNREQVDEHDYLVCTKCGEHFACSLEDNKDKINLTILRKAVRADHQESPEFFG